MDCVHRLLAFVVFVDACVVCRLRFGGEGGGVRMQSLEGRSRMVLAWFFCLDRLCGLGIELRLV